MYTGMSLSSLSSVMSAGSSYLHTHMNTIVIHRTMVTSDHNAVSLTIHTCANAGLYWKSTIQMQWLGRKTLYSIVLVLVTVYNKPWRNTAERYAFAITGQLVWSWPWPLTLKTFSPMPTHMMNICGKLCRNPSPLSTDTALCEIGVNGLTDGRRERLENILPPSSTLPWWKQNICL